jgi:hypothetical protein
MAEDSPDQTTQALWYAGQAESFATSTPKWDNWWVGGWSQSNAWATYPTITMDKDLDVAYTFETFGPNYPAYPNWYTAKAFQPNQNYSDPLLGLGIVDSASSTGEYFPEIICGAPATRWGDYVTTVWDPNFSSPNESDSFWTVPEYTTGQSNESTLWQALADPLPFFVGSAESESECTGGAGSTCAVKLNPPSDLQPGDLLLVGLLLGEPASNPPKLPDSSWILLPASNITGSPQSIASSCCGGFTMTSWLAAHIYTSSDTLPYTFKHFLNLAVELEGSVVDYRGGSTNLSSYTSYGFTQNGLSSSFSTGAVTPPGDTELSTLILGLGEGCPEAEGSEGSPADYGAPQGTPTLSTEATDAFWLAADAPVPMAGQTYGGYTFTETPNGVCTSIGPWLGWEIAIPE